MNSLKKGFTTLSALLLTSLLVSLGGVGTVVAFQQNFSENVRAQLGSVLQAFDQEDEDTTPTPTPTGATGITGATGSSGATGTTGATITTTPTPRPTGTISDDDDQNDEADDRDEDTDENEIEDDKEEDMSGKTELEINITGKIEGRDSEDSDD